MFGSSYIASQLVKRSTDIDFSALTKRDDSSPLNEITGIKMTILFLTGVSGVVFLGLLHYTFKLLLTLTVVEEPPSVYLPLDEDEEGAPKPHLVSHDNQRVFITSSIRGTLRHLRREGGFWSPWRGLGANLCFFFANGFIRGILISTLSIFLPLTLATIVGGIASMVALSRFALVCTHIMITAPNSTSWWTLLKNTSWAQAKKTIPAVLIWATSIQIVAELSVLAAQKGYSSGVRVSLFGTDLLLYILITIPATILLVRVQASVLSDGAATIVPFDKTFGQDTSDTDGVLTVQKAAKSIDWAVFIRVCIFLAKSVPILVVTGTLFIITFLFMFFAWAPNSY